MNTTLPQSAFGAFAQLQAATLAAREKTGDPCIGTQIGAGKIDIVRAIPPKSGRGSYKVEILHARLTLDQAVATLNGMAA